MSGVLGADLPRTLVGYGHSWVAGEGASRPGLGLVEVAAAELGLVPLNRGVGGFATAEVAALVQRDPPPPSALYVVLTGLNDARRRGNAVGAMAAYETDLRAIFGALRGAAPGSLVVAVAQPPLADYSAFPPHHRGSDEVLAAYNDRLRAVAADSSEVLLAPIGHWDPASMLDADTVHPNDAGHAAVAAAVTRQVRGV